MFSMSMYLKFFFLMNLTGSLKRVLTETNTNNRNGTNYIILHITVLFRNYERNACNDAPKCYVWTRHRVCNIRIYIYGSLCMQENVRMHKNEVYMATIHEHVPVFVRYRFKFSFIRWTSLSFDYLLTLVSAIQTRENTDRPTSNSHACTSMPVIMKNLKKWIGIFSQLSVATEEEIHF